MRKNTKKANNLEEIKHSKKGTHSKQESHAKKTNDEKKIAELKRINATKKEKDEREKNNAYSLGTTLDGISHRELRQGIILSEILGKPVSKRRNRQRVGR